MDGPTGKYLEEKSVSLTVRLVAHLIPEQLEKGSPTQISYIWKTSHIIGNKVIY